MNEKEKRKKAEKMQEIIANIIVSIICGIVGAGIGFYVYYKYSRRFATGSGVLLSVIIGFCIGSSYGLWHAIVGWKNYNNDCFKGDDI